MGCKATYNKHANHRNDFVFENDAAILKVPSAIIPEEYNYLINPSHVDAKKIKVLEV
jgi:hypothetical protein